MYKTKWSGGVDDRTSSTRLRVVGDLWSPCEEDGGGQEETYGRAGGGNNSRARDPRRTRDPVTMPAATLRVPETRAEQREGVFTVNREIPQNVGESLQSGASWL